ncbi:hypothetical protein VUR80DRAFT_2552 [Thermomyces stellatus]
MLPDVPVLSDYGISPTTGFLPETLPLTRLPDPYYHKWESVVSELQALILSRRIRPVVDRLPVLSTVGLENEAEWRRAYSLLCFMAHAYIWGGDKPAEKLPASISAPLLQVSEHLQLPPVATYAALCLWNYKPIFPDEPIDDLENLATMNTFTGSLDESWFYLVSVAIEARGAPILPTMMRAISAARAGDARTVAACLRFFAERLTELSAILQRVHENCDTNIFYHRIRPFFAGSKNMADAGLPNGVMYEDAAGNIEYRQYAGGSNAQSSLIQFFDIILGIEHRPTGEKRTADSDPNKRGRGKEHGFIAEMREYMPRDHARFLADVSAVANIRPFVESRKDDSELCLAFDACLAMLSSFRDKHISIATRYIVMKAREARARSRSRSPEATRQRVNLATASTKNQQGRGSRDEPQGDKGKKLTGTGGTSLLPFLKQARDETGEPAIAEWTKAYMNNKTKTQKLTPKLQRTQQVVERDFEPSSGATAGLNGLARSWAMDDDVGEVGGICNY